MPRPRGRPNQGKTQTIRKRAVNVYLPTKELLEEWKKDAKEAGMSLSQYILEAVERERVHGTGPHLPKLELEKTLKETNEELSELQSKYEILEAAFKKRDQDAKQLSKLIERKKDTLIDVNMANKLLKVIKNWPYDEIYIEDFTESLEIEDTDSNSLSRLKEILDLMEDIGLLKRGWLSWKWQGDSKYSWNKKPRREKRLNATRNPIPR
ncbi:MAG: hypothetical protein JSV09_07070 [Thermoplasmata archaeon]|nr:MAG: hypothetical protein JSV09_07070 [Thermoplasmata archaeon]